MHQLTRGSTNGPKQHERESLDRRELGRGRHEGKPGVRDGSSRGRAAPGDCKGLCTLAAALVQSGNQKEAQPCKTCPCQAHTVGQAQGVRRARPWLVISARERRSSAGKRKRECPRGQFLPQRPRHRTVCVLARRPALITKV